MLLATSQQVDLKSQELDDAYCCLLSCWKKQDLFNLGKTIYHFDEEGMEERFYYSGGSVREFARATVEDIRIAILNTVRKVDDAAVHLSSKSNVQSGSDHLDRLRRTFVTDSNATNALVSSRGAGHKSLAGSVFEIYLHRLAADNMLKLYMSEYDPPERRKRNEPRHLEVKEVQLKNGDALCCGTASDHENYLTQWRDVERFTYWFPACHDFLNIDSIVKLESTSDKMSNVA
ncbi:hypothetical protein ON010_g10988 [Phytophthora cinnamomi]|nr:hypothetical protein ON010_g10988 [Phytophthora cinnamomi]